MPRLLFAASLLIVLAFVTQADEPTPQPIQKKEETLKLEEENGKKVLRLTGKQVLRAEGLLHAFVETSGAEVMYMPSQIASFNVTVDAPETGKTYDGDGIEGLLADCLEQFKLCLIESSPNRFVIVQLTEALSVAPIIQADVLKRAPGNRFVTLCWFSSNAAMTMRRLGVSNLMAMEAVNRSTVPGVLFLCDRPLRLLALIPFLEEVDRIAAKREIRFYEGPGGVPPAALAKALDDLVPKDAFVPDHAVSALSGTRLLLVHALPEYQALVPDALKKLAELADVAKPPVSPDVRAVRRYELPQSADTDTVVAALEKLFRDGRRDRPTIVAVPGKKIIVARADSNEHTQISDFIELLK